MIPPPLHRVLKLLSAVEVATWCWHLRSGNTWRRGSVAEFDSSYRPKTRGFTRTGPRYGDGLENPNPYPYPPDPRVQTRQRTSYEVLQNFDFQCSMRSLRQDTNSTFPRNRHAGLGSVLLHIVAAMRNLVSLSEINIPRSPKILGFLAEIHFPRLRGALIPFCRDTTRFLQLQPNLEELSVQTLTINPKLYELPIPPLSLPHLTFFDGPDTVAEVLVDSSLSQISIYWNPQRKAPASAVYDAISHSGAELLSVYNSISYWDPALLTTIAANAPKATSLSFDNFGRIYDLGDVELNPEDHHSVRGSTLDNEFQMWFIANVRSSTSLPSKYAALLETEYGKEIVADVEASCTRD
ncbi:hypothetical protein C8R45DRAFT_941018 [Mycena sanguinolenta]|nr:hypothetical protein C8R45DRAFT_941018 [Mycena sanguinolenta]